MKKYTIKYILFPLLLAQWRDVPKTLSQWQQANCPMKRR